MLFLCKPPVLHVLSSSDVKIKTESNTGHNPTAVAGLQAHDSGGRVLSGNIVCAEASKEGTSTNGLLVGQLLSNSCMILIRFLHS